MPTTASAVSHTPTEYRTGKAASYITSTAGFLSVYETSRQTLQIISPRPGSTLGAGSRYLWAHSGFAYNVVVAPQGGSPPYKFYLSAGASGATITAEAPSWNPNLYLWGRINWASPSGTVTMTVRVVDQEGSQATVSWLVTTQNNKFIFFDASAGNDTTGDGTISLPWQTMAKWGTTNADTTHQYKIAVYKNGTYNAATYDGATVNMIIQSTKPTAHIRYPGHDPVWNLASAGIGMDATGTTNDVYLAIKTTSGRNDQNNLKLIACNGNQNRFVMDRVRFNSPPASLVGDDNPCCIFTSSGGTHTDFSLVDTTWTSLGAGTTACAATDFFSVDNLTILGGQGTALNANNGIYLKGANTAASIFGVDFWDESGNTTTEAKFTFQQADAGLESGKVEVGYCRAYQGDGSGSQEATLLIGDSNQQWGEVDCYRLLLAGRSKYNGANVENFGTSTLSNSIYYCDAATPVQADITQSGNVGRARSAIATDLSSGNLTGSFASTYYGTKGPEVASS